MTSSNKLNGIKAIETIYDGYRFRSRLEAKWAVFFNLSGIKFEYEPEGYDLGPAGYYLPDFWLPDVWERGSHRGVFVEIKPNEQSFTKECEAKVEALVKGTGHPLILCCGLPVRSRDGFGVCCSELKYGCHEYVNSGDSLFNGSRWDDRMHFQGGPLKHFIEYNNHNYDHGCDESLFLAAKAAKQARFEHGENSHGRRK